MENSARTFIHYANRFVNFILKNGMHQAHFYFVAFFFNVLFGKIHTHSGESYDCEIFACSTSDSWMGRGIQSMLLMVVFVAVGGAAAAVVFAVVVAIASITPYIHYNATTYALTIWFRLLLAFITMANDLKCQIMPIYSFSLYSFVEECWPQSTVVTMCTYTIYTY